MKNAHDKEFEFHVYGHPNITARHRTTWQITKEDHLTINGDCIIGIGCDYGLIDLPPWLKNHLIHGGKIQIQFEVEGTKFQGTAQGNSDLSFKDEVDMVFRKSAFISDRTAAINCSFTAQDLPQEMVKALKDPLTKMTIIIKPIEI